MLVDVVRPRHNPRQGSKPRGRKPRGIPGLNPDEPGFRWFGVVLAVPDKFWGFAALGRSDHPGLMIGEVGESGEGRHLFAFKGTHAEGAKRLYNQLLVEPDAESGLTKETLFLLEPRRLPRRAALLMHADRRMGCLGAEDRQRLESELLRILGPDTGLGDEP